MRKRLRTFLPMNASFVGRLRKSPGRMVLNTAVPAGNASFEAASASNGRSSRSPPTTAAAPVAPRVIKVLRFTETNPIFNGEKMIFMWVEENSTGTNPHQLKNECDLGFINATSGPCVSPRPPRPGRTIALIAAPLGGLAQLSTHTEG